MPLDLQSLRGIILGISPVLQKFTKAVEENLYIVRDYINALRLNSSVLKPTGDVDFNGQNATNINKISGKDIEIIYTSAATFANKSFNFLVNSDPTGFNLFAGIVLKGDTNSLAGTDGGYILSQGTLYLGIDPDPYFKIGVDSLIPVNSTATLGYNVTPFQDIYTQNIYADHLWSQAGSLYLGDAGIDKFFISGDYLLPVNATASLGDGVNNFQNIHVSNIYSNDSIENSGLVTIGNNAGNNPLLTLKGRTSGSVTISTAAAAGTWTLTLPTTAGSSGQFLQTDGAGVTTWATATGGGGGLTWSEITGTSQTMSINTGYIANNAGLVTLTLPSTSAVGDVVRVTGKGAGGWRIAQPASVVIHFGNADTTTGTGGYLQFTHRRDSVELVCVVANTEWNVVSSMGNIDLV